LKTPISCLQGCHLKKCFQWADIRP
jgi:hypothetical protein